MLICLSVDMHEMAVAYEKCLGAYCGRTVDEFGNISSCGVRCHDDELILLAISFL